jgi:predicted enzyme related to lactoylglutathione lyase
MTVGELVHLELHTDDLAGAEEFYRALLGWRARCVTTGGPPYLSVDVGVSAGLVGCGASPAVWIPYVEVSDLEAATRAAVALGAERTLAPRTGPGGRRSVLRSPIVGDLALWEPA